MKINIVFWSTTESPIWHVEAYEFFYSSRYQGWIGAKLGL
jgi:hypothetical protein